jgi:hypothetical protein
MRDEGDRFVAWRLDDASATLGTDLEDERMERALLAYAHRSATRVGAEWFAAEFARREEEDRLLEADAAAQQETADEPIATPSPEMTLIDASVEDAVLGGAPMGLGLGPEPPPQSVTPEPMIPEPAALEPVADPVVEPARPEPAPVEPVAAESVTPEPIAPEPVMRHPHVPRPPAPEPTSQPKRRRGHRKQVEAPTPSFVISAPEWARMSPGARRLYGLDAAPPAEKAS